LRFKHSCETPVKILVGFERFERVYRSASWLVAYPLAKIKLRSIADAKFSHVDDVVNKKRSFLKLLFLSVKLLFLLFGRITSMI
jgi:hypothetical protein